MNTLFDVILESLPTVRISEHEDTIENEVMDTLHNEMIALDISVDAAPDFRLKVASELCWGWGSGSVTIAKGLPQNVADMLIDVVINLGGRAKRVGDDLTTEPPCERVVAMNGIQAFKALSVAVQQIRDLRTELLLGDNAAACLTDDHLKDGGEAITHYMAALSHLELAECSMQLSIESAADSDELCSIVIYRTPAENLPKIKAFLDETIEQPPTRSELWHTKAMNPKYRIAHTLTGRFHPAMAREIVACLKEFGCEAVVTGDNS